MLSFSGARGRSFRGNFLVTIDSTTISIWDLMSILFVLFFLYTVIYPQSQLKRIRIQRMAKLKAMEKRHGCKVLTMIHRREAVSLFGLPAYQFIDEEDAEQVLRWIRQYKDYPLEIILHTPGGQLLASIQIARALGNTPKIPGSLSLITLCQEARSSPSLQTKL